MRKYLITQEQIELIEHFKRMFQVDADMVQDLCNSEKDDIVYGFELGKLHSHLRDCFIEMMELESEIRKQMVVNNELITSFSSEDECENEAITFTNKRMKNVGELLSEDYKIGYKEGVEHYLTYKNNL